METLILLLLLTLSDKNGNMKETLNRFLCFYKENRELIQIIANMFGDSKGGKNAQNGVSEKPEEQKENRPREEVGNLNILEEYLRRANA